MKNPQSELTVITKAKDLCSYIMIVTQKSPKCYRFTFVSRMQNLSLDVIENLFRANDTFVKKGDVKAFENRQEYQRSAMTSLKLLTYIALLSKEQECILSKQYYQISIQSTEVMKLLGAWMKGDIKRFQS